MPKKIFIIAIFLSLGLVFCRDVLVSAEVDNDVREFLKDLEEAINEMDTYSCIMVTESWRGKLYEKRIVRFSFKKPNLMRTDVLEGKKRGSSVVLNKKGKVRGRSAWGFLDTLRHTDKRLKNLRGATFMNSSMLDKLERLREHIFKRGCEAELDEEEYADREVYHLRIRHKDEDDSITLEDLWYDEETYTILKNTKYEGKDKAADTAWQEFEVNIPLDDSLFEL
ncbi:MAG: hypothetical protein HQ575_01970 [Candidatus Omnitrophica bacterium]|nr:hypothetical protein [Candidatus Omnitrophota bacterium]